MSTADGRPDGVTLSNWDLGGAPSDWAYLHGGELFSHVEIPIAATLTMLQQAETPGIGEFPVEPATSLDQYIVTEPVSGIVIVHRGIVVYERYPRMRPDDRHLLMSVTKVFTAALIGILESRGQLDLSRTVGSIIAELAGSDWAGIPVHDVLNMASGINCLELGQPGAYSDPDHSFYRFEASLGLRPRRSDTLASAYDFIATLPAYRPPGEIYEYTGANTFVLSWLIERITGLSFAEVLHREIWARAGFESPAQLWTSDSGAPASHGGICITVRDLARFGMLFTPSDRRIANASVIDRDQLRRIQTGGQPELHPDLGKELPDYVTAAYGNGLPPASRQWNLAHPDGDLFKGGFGGQGLYVSPARDLVIAFTGIPRADGSTNRLRWYSRRLALTFAFCQ